ncbi:MAG TPA: carboxypeptidase regulatory-like domain-containing protein, partial [Bryobacteraceae bacterium]|nr:carboxypeptidase regulatory-like domain-containing protein [Bryobacteraceae bacterium]
MQNRLCQTILLGLLLSVGLFAQTGTIQGVIIDAGGASVPNAKITAVDEGKKLVIREAVSDTAGTFALRSLPPATYTLKVEAAGFKSLDRPSLVLDQNQVLSLGDVSLQVGQATESITVEASTPLVQTDTAQRGMTITERQVTQLPLNGRDFTSLMRTLPGVVTTANSDFRLAFNNTDQFNVNGLRGSMNNVFLDGSIITDVGANDGQYTQISLDAVGEFRVQTSTFNAEYGRNPGVMISINTKAGTSEFHGTLYEFLRNNALDARRPFDTTGKTQKLRYNQFGGNLGGPILIPKLSTGENKKLFFFFNYEGTRATRPVNTQTFVDVPNSAVLGGDLSGLYRPGFILGADNSTPTQFRNGQVFRPGTVVRGPGGRIIGGDPYPNNVIPQSEWSRNAPAFLRVLGALDRSGGQALAANPELVRVPFAPEYQFNKNAFVARIDYNISPNANFFFRWADDKQDESDNRGIFATTPFAIYPQMRKKPGSSWSWNLINVISPTVTNEAIFTYNHLTQLVDVADFAEESEYDRTALGFAFQELYPESNLRNRFPRFDCGIGSCNFGGFPSGWLSEGKTFAFTDNVTMVRGAHTLKFGGFWNRNLNGQQPGGFDAVQIGFGSNADNPNDTGNTFANML